MLKQSFEVLVSVVGVSLQSFIFSLVAFFAKKSNQEKIYTQYFLFLFVFFVFFVFSSAAAADNATPFEEAAETAAVAAAEAAGAANIHTRTTKAP
jgi:NADH:ubiquinone oxidoreductase subunit H